jgi:uncharacterized membrane protein YebE (DUF533 family)
MKGLDGDTFASAVAHTARNASMRAAGFERVDPDRLKEIGFLANLAEQHAGQNQYVTLSMVSDVRYTVADIEASRTFSRPFGQ